MPITTDSQPNTYEMDEITRTADVAGIPLTISPSAAVTNANFRRGNDEIMRMMNAYDVLREQWSCDEPGHKLCLQGNEFVGHIQLSKEQISIWISKICRGQATCRYPPKVFIVPDGSGSNRNPNFDWGASETTIDTEAEIEPGYFCGLALERIGGIILYRSKVWLLCAKLLVYDRIVNRRHEVTGGLDTPPSTRKLGIILQETVDLMRHFSIQPHLWFTFNALARTIKTITSLIAASPDPEISFGEIQAENVVNAFVNFFSRFDPTDFYYLPYDLEDVSRLKTDSDSLLLLIANPFTGRSVLSSSYCMSILEDNGWAGSAPSASGRATISSPHSPLEL
ncbi:hypothetical protein BU17DRAFT_95964 [Hysterangium stoloniferum]|nr:hypothetical protein BU17DRAFT_95964 [Hysterangium stoloniferum]